MDTNPKSSLLSLDTWFKGRWCPEWALDLWLEDVGSTLPLWPWHVIFLTLNTNIAWAFTVCPTCTRHPICLLISSFPIRQVSLSSLCIQEDWGSRDRSSSPSSSRAGIQIHVCLPPSFHCYTHVLWASVYLWIGSAACTVYSSEGSWVVPVRQKIRMCHAHKGGPGHIYACAYAFTHTHTHTHMVVHQRTSIICNPGMKNYIRLSIMTLFL